MRKIVKKYKNSLVIKLSMATVLVMTILFSVLIISNIYSLHVVKSNVINSAMNEIKIHINDMDNCLNNTVNDLNEIYLNIDDIGDLKSNSESVRYFAAKRLQDILKERSERNRNIDSFSIYNPLYDTLISSNSSRLDAYDKFGISEFIKNDLLNRKDSLSDLWSSTKINNKVFFFKIYRFSDSIIVAFIKADTLMSFVNGRGLSTDKQIVLTDNTGNALVKVGAMNFSNISYPLPNDQQVVNKLADQYILVSTNSATSYARLSAIIKERNVILGLGYIQWIIAALGIISLFVMPYIIYYLNKEIIKPVRSLVLGTRQIEEGNLEYHVDGTGSSSEFEILTRSFNSMVKEIKNLKISAYEEKIEMQKAELKYLQMQIKPHFFLNALTTIHSMAYKDKNYEIRKFIDALSIHLRYMFKGALNKVQIKEEIEYIKNYFYMQEIKYPNNVFYVIDIDPSVEYQQIPQFIIHTFVENSFKHAMTLDETLSIFIKAKYCVYDGNVAAKIVIEDNGEGFTEEILDKVNNSDYTDETDGYKIGISNIKRTLALLYGKDNLLKISNDESLGSKVEILIPIER